VSAPETPVGPLDVFAGLVQSASETGSLRLAERAAAAQSAFEALSLEHQALEHQLAATNAQAQREVEKAATIARVAEMVNSSLDIDVVLRRVLDAAVEVLGAQRGFVMIADAVTDALVLAAMHGLDRAAIDSDEMRPSQTAVRRVFASGETLITTDAQSDPRFNAQLSVRLLNLRSIICVPLNCKARRIGVMYLDSRVMPGLFTPQDPSLLIAFANQAALAIENARLFNEQRAQLREISWLEELQAKVLSSITNGVITIDAAGIITTFNGAAQETLGVPAAAMTGRPVSALDALIPRLSALIGQSELVGRPIEVGATHPLRGALTLEIRIAPLELDDASGHGRPHVAIAITDLTERRALETMHRTDVEQRHAIGDAFSRYLAPHVVELLMKSPSTVELGGERNTATILFADIRDFTKMAARMEAERVVEILNAYFEAAVAVLFEHDGLLDKFYGDGLMAVFGPPRVRSDDAARALRSAARLHEVVRELEPIIREPLRISVGLATGEVVAGHIGSTRRLDYTVIGDAVNLASRLQSAAPPSATYCDETTYVRAGLDLRGERLQAKIKGREDLVTVYRLS
jgi:class 3 adenylate cyclase/putative methionine-R-sulfoxide reductase with GAF domain